MGAGYEVEAIGGGRSEVRATAGVRTSMRSPRLFSGAAIVAGMAADVLGAPELSSASSSTLLAAVSGGLLVFRRAWASLGCVSST